MACDNEEYNAMVHNNDKIIVTLSFSTSELTFR